MSPVRTPINPSWRKCLYQALQKFFPYVNLNLTLKLVLIANAYAPPPLPHLFTKMTIFEKKKNNMQFFYLLTSRFYP